MRKIELLAPAKNLEYAITAINCGADAVYIGAPKFGARSNASNTTDDIKKLIEYAHLYGAKVYITINTLLNDNEIQEAQKLINELYEIKADAIIIQDMGILELDLPPIPVHASTQCFINTPEKAAFLQSLGIERIILPRETSLQQIKNFKKITDIELESFIHGALCVGYSGQCYLSYALGKRSGNKGNCAQPCRKKYSLVDAKGKIICKEKHLLSLKDLNLFKNIEQLIDAGVTSFKIEGRLKDISYIKNIVSFYRQEIDKVIKSKNLQKSSCGKSFIDFKPDPFKTFNRGYTDYCISSNAKNISSFDTPKSIGETIGKVAEVKKGLFKIQTDKKLINGDGICFIKNGQLQGFYINKIQSNTIFTDKAAFLKAGDTVYRNHNHAFIKKLENSSISRKIFANASVLIDKEQIVFKYEDENNTSAEKTVLNTFETAKNKEKATDNIKKQLSKSGDTPFGIENVFINAENIPFMPVKFLNEIRRELLEKLRDKKTESYQNKKAPIILNDVPYPQKELSFNGNVSNKLAQEFYKRHGVNKIEPAAEAGTDLKCQTIMTSKLCIKKELNLCKSKDIKEPLFLLDKKGNKLELKFNCATCEMQIVNS